MFIRRHTYCHGVLCRTDQLLRSVGLVIMILEALWDTGTDTGNWIWPQPWRAGFWCLGMISVCPVSSVQHRRSHPASSLCQKVGATNFCASSNISYDITSRCTHSPERSSSCTRHGSSSRRRLAIVVVALNHHPPDFDSSSPATANCILPRPPTRFLSPIPLPGSGLDFEGQCCPSPQLQNALD